MSGQRKIGGSDIAKIVGLSPYGSSIDVYRRLVDGWQTEQTPAMRRGILLEPVVRQFYLDETRATLEPHPGILQSEKHDFMTASVDDLADGRVVEYKTANLRMREQWGEGASDIPRQYYAQVAWYMAATDRPSADVAVLIAGDEFRVYRIERDLELEGYLIDAAAKFWRDHIVQKRPPPVDGSAAYAEYFKDQHRTQLPGVVKASAEDVEWAQVWRIAREQKKRAEAKEAEAKAHLVNSIGQLEGMMGEGFKISYRLSKGSPSTDWGALCRANNISQETIDSFTERNPHRVFKPTFKGEDQ